MQPLGVLAQETAFAVAIPGSDITPAERTALGLDGETLGDTLEFLRFGELPTSPSLDGLTFKLDTSGLAYAFDVRLYDSESGTDFRLAGELAGHSFYLTYDPVTGYRGSGTVDTTSVDFYPLTDRISRIRYTVQDRSQPGPECGSADAAPDLPSTEAVEPCEGIIDVLYLRSAAADARLPTWGGVYDFEDFVERINDRANLTLLNSNLGGIKFNSKLHTTTVEVANSGFNIFHLGDVVIADNYIKLLRQQYDADIVAYYPDHATQHAGIAGGILPPYDRAYHVTGMENELDHNARFILNKHELGHVLGGVHGLKHDFYSPDILDMPNMLRTTMGDGLHHERIADHYSNPNVDYEFALGGRVPTGTATNNNAVRINRGACIVKDYETHGGFRSQAIVRPDKKNPCGSPVELCGRVDAGNTGGTNGGPYTYEWRWSISPGAATTFLSDDTCVTFARPFAQQATYYLTLKVTSTVSGQSTFSYTGVNFDAYCHISVPVEETPTPRVAAYGDAEEATKVSYTLSGQRRYLSLTSPASVADREVEFSVYDPLGRVAYTERTRLDILREFAANVPAGLYFVTLADAVTGELLGTSAVHNIHGR